MDRKLKSFGGNQKGRVILLGDGTEVLTDSDNTEMFDHDDEDMDLDSQVHKGQVTGPDSKDSELKTGATPEKIDSTVADKALRNPTEKKTDEVTSDTQAK